MQLTGNNGAFHTLCVVGLGYIGLPTAATFASRGLDVLGVDVNPNVVEKLNAGESHFSEPDLDILLRAAVQTGKLKAALKPAAADAFILAVPTPFKDGKKPDMSYVEAATASIIPVLKKGDLVILESTSPVGATRAMAEQIAAARPDLKIALGKGGDESTDINLVHCPERILPGQMVRELVENDRIMGGVTPACAERALALYSLFVRGESFLTDADTAELVKLTENAFRDVNIAFANELSLICAELGTDVWEVIQLANKHPRVNILRPGPGVGGHCIAVDPWFIVDAAPKTARLMRLAREVNDSKPHWVVDQVKRHADRFKAPTIACLGLAYKPDVDDLRESPAIDVVQELAEAKVGKILVCEPHVAGPPAAIQRLKGVSMTDAATAVSEADIVVMLVGHKAFRKIPQPLLMNRIVLDTVGFWR